MKKVIDLPARSAPVTGFPLFRSSFQAIDSLRKLEGHPFLSDSFTAPEKIAVDDLIMPDRPLKHFYGPFMA
jgi:hypothetical protein